MVPLGKVMLGVEVLEEGTEETVTPPNEPRTVVAVVREAPSNCVEPPDDSSAAVSSGVKEM